MGIASFNDSHAFNESDLEITVPNLDIKPWFKWLTRSLQGLMLIIPWNESF